MQQYIKRLFFKVKEQPAATAYSTAEKIRIYTSIGGEFTRPREKRAAKFLLQTRKEVYELEFRMNTMLTNCFLVKLSALDNELSSFISKLNKRDPSIMT